MEKTYKHNKQNNISFMKQWIERYNNTSHDFYDDYHIDEIDNSLSKAKELWWNASVHIYNDFTSYLKELNLEYGVILCICISNFYTKTNVPHKWDNAILEGIDTPPSLYIYNKNNADIISWLKQCTLLECEYIKGTEVYYHEIKDVDDCYKTIFITQTKL